MSEADWPVLMEPSCETLFMCIITTLKEGMRAGGGISDVLRKPAASVSQGCVQVFTQDFGWIEISMKLWYCGGVLKKFPIYYLHETIMYCYPMAMAPMHSLSPIFTYHRSHCFTSECCTTSPFSSW